MEMKTANLRPGDIYLWNKCPRCFYLKNMAGIDQGMNGFPKLFAQIEKQVREVLVSTNLKKIFSEFPDGTILNSNRAAESTVTVYEDLGIQMYISGKYDDLVELADGSFMLLKFVTDEPNADKLTLITQQLNAYAWALQHSNKPDKQRNITRLGIVVFDPIKFIKGDPDDYFYQYIEVVYSPDDFAKLLREMAEVLCKDEAPEPTIGKKTADTCSFCERDLQVIQYDLKSAYNKRIDSLERELKLK